MGVYGLITGLPPSPMGARVTRQLATGRPTTIFSSGNENRKRAVLCDTAWRGKAVEACAKPAGA